MDKTTSVMFKLSSSLYIIQAQANYSIWSNPPVTFPSPVLKDWSHLHLKKEIKSIPVITMAFLTRHNILNKSQIGFLLKQHTFGHIYSLHTHLKSEQRKTFTCVVYFKMLWHSIWILRTALFQQGRGVRDAVCLDRSGSIPHALHDSEFKCLLHVDDLLLLSPTAEGLRQSLALLEQYCKEWALTGNLD